MYGTDVLGLVEESKKKLSVMVYCTIVNMHPHPTIYMFWVMLNLNCMFYVHYYCLWLMILWFVCFSSITFFFFLNINWLNMYIKFWKCLIKLFKNEDWVLNWSYFLLESFFLWALLWLKINFSYYFKINKILINNSFNFLQKISYFKSLLNYFNKINWIYNFNKINILVYFLN